MDILMIYWLENWVVLALALWKIAALAAAGVPWGPPLEPGQAAAPSALERVREVAVLVPIYSLVTLVLGFWILRLDPTRDYGMEHALVLVPLVVGQLMVFSRYGKSVPVTPRHLIQTTYLRMFPLVVGAIWGAVGFAFSRSILPALFFFVLVKLALDLGILKWDERDAAAWRR